MEENRLPNAGLYDQRLMFQFVRDWIGNISGDKTAVNAWEVSAGAGSILHHLNISKWQPGSTLLKNFVADFGSRMAMGSIRNTQCSVPNFL